MSFGSGPRPGVGGCPGFATERNSKYPATASTIAAFAVSTPLGRMEVGNPAVPPKELVDAILKDNRTEEFEKLRGAPGICLDPVPWDTARQLVQENSVESLSKLGRHPAGIVQYRSFRSKVSFVWLASSHRGFLTGLRLISCRWRQILGSYVTAGDYIKITILQHSSSLNSGLTPPGCSNAYGQQSTSLSFRKILIFLQTASELPKTLRRSPIQSGERT